MRADEFEKKTSYGYQSKPVFMHELRTIDWNQLRVEASLVALGKLITSDESETLLNGLCGKESMRYVGKVAAIIAEGLVDELKRIQEDESK